jgi:hypothetical protein
MPQPRFDDVRECLLRAGVAPRHVRRYVAELGDHFEDLVGEEISRGMARGAAERNAGARLGSDEDLARGMLDRPELRSLSARYPWAVFVLAPAMLPAIALVAAVLVEIASFDVISTFYKNPAHVPPPAWFVDTVAAWNWSATHALPLVLAILLCVMGVAQRMRPAWTIAGVALACLAGAFQQVSWHDNGYHGVLMLGSGLFPPFPHDMLIAGIWRTLADFAIVAAVWFVSTRRSAVWPSHAESPDQIVCAETGTH